MSTKAEIQQSVIGFLDSYNPEKDFSFEDRSDREHLAIALVDHLDEQQMLHLTDSAEVEEEKQADDIAA